MKRKLPIVLIGISIFLNGSFQVSAESSYVLPYPSAMPGNKLYVVELIREKVLRYWHFGDFGKFTYDLMYADKYLVEAQTLFEYRQFSLALGSLKKSNIYFDRLENDLAVAKDHGKNITEKEIVFLDAKEKHTEVLRELKSDLPEEQLWQEEKKSQQRLKIHELLDQSIRLRE